ncbi:hypothetical protein DPMN_120887 [Dreissena polymorpha]|uniref:Uncharacterized protein n=1 Tax=Dreissena polymorpha TaxID=45954 RepID=A0A9D4JQK3_DREPO|nr:hypothetical protein DPMN_120887 [Dreissena polymorpha]
MEAAQSKDYVDNIMSASQPIPKHSDCSVSTSTSRKRHSSDTPLDTVFSKKVKETQDETDSVMASARRTLYGQTPSKPCVEGQVIGNSGIAVILQKLDRLSEEVKEVNRSLTDRIDTLENE